MSEEHNALGKVIHRVDEYSFAINRGSANGLKVGDNYLIVRLGEQLKDPDTGEDLGVLEIVVGRARVSHVQERLATLISSETHTVAGKRKIVRREGGGIFASLSTSAVEEIEEGGQTYKQEIAVEIGDLAKPV